MIPKSATQRLPRRRALALPCSCLLAIALLVFPALVASAATQPNIALSLRPRWQGDTIVSIDIIATINSSIIIDHVELSLSPVGNGSFGSPVWMTFANYTSAANLYNYTYETPWSSNFIRIQIVVQYTNGQRSLPFSAASSWAVTSVPMSQPLFDGAFVGIVIAAVAAAVALGVAVVLRVVLRGRAL